MHMKAAFLTLGCKVNQYETQALKEKFIEKGYEIVDEEAYADVYVINTCTVTGMSDRKSRQLIRRVKKVNPESITAVIGCYAQINPEEIEKIEGVNIIAGTNEKNRLLDYIDEYNRHKDQLVKVKDIDEIKDYEDIGISSMDSKTRAYIKIQEGCNQFCSYCIIPYARGGVRSRNLDEIIAEAEKLVEGGFKELVITGINTALYGVERGSLQMESVIKGINGIEGDFRIRLSSLEPTVINADYVGTLLQYKKLCPHLHISLQSGSDDVLKRMNRHYTLADYEKIVMKLRAWDPNYAITTDIITGFPGETEADFQSTKAFIKKMKFCKVHVFKYSKREGTEAAKMKDQISQEIKARRSMELIQIAEKAACDFYESNFLTNRPVLFEDKNQKTGYYEGFTDNYIKVYCNSSEDVRNQIKEVKLIKRYEEGIFGEIL